MPLTKLQKYWFTVVLKEPFVTSLYYQEVNFLYIELRGVVTSEELRDTFLLNCDLIMENKVELVMVDFSRLCTVSMEDQIWIVNHAQDYLSESKVNHIATVLAPEIFQNIVHESTASMGPKVPFILEIQDFVNKENALAWLFPEIYN